MSTEGPHESQDWSEKKMTGSPLRLPKFLGNTLRQRMLRGGGLAVLAAIAVAAIDYKIESGQMNDKLEAASNKAAAVIDGERLSKSQTKQVGANCINGLVRLKPGVVVRSSPSVIESEKALGVLPLDGNRVSLFSGNEGVLIVRPRWESNKEGQWISFYPSQAVPKGNTVNKVADSKEIQERLDYVQIPQDSQGRMFSKDSTTIQLVQPHEESASTISCLWDASGSLMSKKGDLAAYDSVISNSADFDTVVEALSASGLTMPGVKGK